MLHRASYITLVQHLKANSTKRLDNTGILFENYGIENAPVPVILYLSVRVELVKRRGLVTGQVLLQHRLGHEVSG
jgi:hypothetical protein